MALTRENGRWVFRYRDGTVVVSWTRPPRATPALKLIDSRIFPPHGGEGFTLDACVTALFHTAA